MGEGDFGAKVLGLWREFWFPLHSLPCVHRAMLLEEMWGGGGKAGVPLCWAPSLGLTPAGITTHSRLSLSGRRNGRISSGTGWRTCEPSTGNRYTTSSSWRGSLSVSAAPGSQEGPDLTPLPPRGPAHLHRQPGFKRTGTGR